MPSLGTSVAEPPQAREVCSAPVQAGDSSSALSRLRRKPVSPAAPISVTICHVEQRLRHQA